MEEADFLRALLAEMLHQDFQLKSWITVVSKWRQILVMDSRTGYDLLNRQALGEDKRLAIDISAMRQALQEDGGARCVRWVPGEELIADGLTKLQGNGKLMQVMQSNLWALKDTDQARQLRADAAARKQTYRRKLAAERQAAEGQRRADTSSRSTRG